MKTDHKLFKTLEDIDFGLITIKEGKRIVIGLMHENEVVLRIIILNHKGGFIGEITPSSFNELLGKSLEFIRDNPRI